PILNLLFLSHESMFIADQAYTPTLKGGYGSGVGFDNFAPMSCGKEGKVSGEAFYDFVRRAYNVESLDLESVGSHAITPGRMERSIRNILGAVSTLARGILFDCKSSVRKFFL